MSTNETEQNIKETIEQLREQLKSKTEASSSSKMSDSLTAESKDVNSAGSDNLGGGEIVKDKNQAIRELMGKRNIRQTPSYSIGDSFKGVEEESEQKMSSRGEFLAKIKQNASANDFQKYQNTKIEEVLRLREEYDNKKSNAGSYLTAYSTKNNTSLRQAEDIEITENFSKTVTEILFIL